ncbi:MAG: hypothetical protein M3Y08_00880 [Fibrobacterota bacterium]|nr:hypothetical protein [Fibrobacterota bacterium]
MSSRSASGPVKTGPFHLSEPVTASTPSPRRLSAIVTLLLLPWLTLAFVGDPVSHVPQTLACLGAAFAVYWVGCVGNRFRLTAIHALVIGLAARLFLLPMPPSDDIHRFIWEGTILGHGFNPYVMAPSHPELTPLRDANWALINHPDLPTLYPPLAQAVFFLLAKLGGSEFLFKIGFLVFDVLGFLAMRKIVGRRFQPSVSRDDSETHSAPVDPGAHVLAVYFLNPLLIFEIAGRGHFDSLPVFFNLVFFGALLARKPWAPTALCLGAMAKISSLAMAPLLLFSLGWKRALAWGIGIGAVVCGSLWATGAFTVLGKFATKFRFNAAFPSLIDAALPFLAADVRRMANLALFGLTCLVCLRVLRKAAPERQALWFMGLLLLFSPTLHPWYLLWALPFMALTHSRPWLLLTGTVFITYEVYGRMYVTGHWRENPWLRLPEFLPPLFLFLYYRWKARFR